MIKITVICNIKITVICNIKIPHKLYMGSKTMQSTLCTKRRKNPTNPEHHAK